MMRTAPRTLDGIPCHALTTPMLARKPKVYARLMVAAPGCTYTELLLN